MNAWLTPAVLQPCEGYVHSVFERTANVMLGEKRLVTLLSPSLPRVPDAIRIPVDWLHFLAVGMPVRLADDQLCIGGRALSIVRDTAWRGKILPHSGIPATEAFLNLTADLSCGMDLLPEKRRNMAETALCTADWPSFIGLGCGLTPSYDDMCVGMLAVYRAQGQEMSGEKADLSQTTDVSARYLRLALEGYFGEPVCNVIEALYGNGDLAEAVEAIQQVGATSGRDMLRGMRLALNQNNG